MTDRFLHTLDDVREEQEAMLERQQDPDFALASDFAVGALSEEQAREVRARIERDPEFRDLVDPLLKLSELGPGYTPSPRHVTQKRWTELLDKLRRTSADPQVIAAMAEARDRRKRRLAILLPIAAMFLFVVVLSSIRPIAGFVKQFDNRVPAGTTQIVDLGGGSKATLASGSDLDKSGTDPENWYFFSGDAVFEITPGRAAPFVVHMGSAEVVVTGTKFRVHGYAHEPAEVTVIEGAVQVWGIDENGVRIGQPLSLTAGQRARAYRTKLPELLP